MAIMMDANSVESLRYLADWFEKKEHDMNAAQDALEGVNLVAHARSLGFLEGAETAWSLAANMLRKKLNELEIK